MILPSMLLVAFLVFRLTRPSDLSLNLHNK